MTLEPLLYIGQNVSGNTLIGTQWLDTTLGVDKTRDVMTPSARKSKREKGGRLVYWSANTTTSRQRGRSESEAVEELQNLPRRVLSVLEV